MDANWCTTRAADPRCKIGNFMSNGDPNNPDRHKQQTMPLVSVDTPEIEMKRSLAVFGFCDVPDRVSEVNFSNVLVPKENMLISSLR